MLEVIDTQKRGDLTKRLQNVAWRDSGVVHKEHFTKLVVDELQMGQSDLDSLLKVTRFAAIKGKAGHQPWDVIRQHIEGRVFSSK